jgi:hypothetical protein
VKGTLEDPPLLATAFSYNSFTNYSLNREL